MNEFTPLRDPGGHKTAQHREAKGECEATDLECDCLVVQLHLVRWDAAGSQHARKGEKGDRTGNSTSDQLDEGTDHHRFQVDCSWHRQVFSGTNLDRSSQNGTTDSHRDRGLRSGLVKEPRCRATTEESVMSNCTRYLGLDVHAETITAAIAGPSMVQQCHCGGIACCNGSSSTNSC